MLEIRCRVTKARRLAQLIVTMMIGSITVVKHIKVHGGSKRAIIRI
jgi:hypothetical protein